MAKSPGTSKSFPGKWKNSDQNNLWSFQFGSFFWLFWPKVITTSKSVAAILKELRPEVQFSSISQVRKGNGDWYRAYPWQAGCIVLPQWEPLSNLDEWLTLGGIIITSEEEPEGDLCSDLGKTTRIGLEFWKCWMTMEPCEVAGSSALWRRWLVLLRWILLSKMQVETPQCRCKMDRFNDRIGSRLGHVETSWNFDCHAGSVATISVGST